MERPTVAKANRSAAKKIQKPAVDKAGLPKRKAAPKAAKSPGKKKPAAATKAADALLRLVERSLDDDKAVDVAVLSLAGKTSIADYMVVASGRSQRQVGAMAEHLAQRIKKEGLGAAKVEGMPQNDWVLVDAGDVIVHLFRPEVRTFYNLEKMWAADFDAEAAAGT
jgi:ribosome-associated protein